MEELIGLSTAAVAVAKVVHIVGRWLVGSHLGAPDRCNDGVRVVRFDSGPVAHPPAAVVRQHRWGAAVTLIVLGAVQVVLAAAGELGWALVGVAEFVVLLVLLLPTLRRRGAPDMPAHAFSTTVRVVGPLDAVVARVRDGLSDAHALTTVGTRIEVTEQSALLEGGNGMWGVDRDAGYRIRATVTPGAGHWDVTVESTNFVPTLLQSLRNQRNVGRVVRGLLA